MVDTEYLDKFETQLLEQLLKLCTQYKMLGGVLLGTEDIDNHWKQMAPEYMVDAVPEIQNYPTVSVSWAGYLGMAVAMGWDSDWEMYQTFGYKQYYGSRGFDDMDENILYNMLHVEANSEEAQKIESILRRCVETAVTLIRREQIDPQTPMAFHVFARTCRTMFRIGAAIQLNRLGYKFEKVYLN